MHVNHKTYSHHHIRPRQSLLVFQAMIVAGFQSVLISQLVSQCHTSRDTVSFHVIVGRPRVCLSSRIKTILFSLTYHLLIPLFHAITITDDVD